MTTCRWEPRSGSSRKRTWRAPCRRREGDIYGLDDALRLCFWIFFGLCFVYGCLSCFFGYRIFLAILTLLGFLVGGPVGCLVSLLWQPEGDFPAPIWMLLVGLACAFIGAYLAQHLYRVGIFLVGAVAGIATGALVAGAAEQTPEGWWLWLCAVGGGLAALLAQKLMIVLATAFSGAIYIALSLTCFKGTLGLYGLFGLSGLCVALGESLALILGLTVAGVAVQFGLTARGAPTPREQYLTAQGSPRPATSDNSHPAAAPGRVVPVAPFPPDSLKRSTAASHSKRRLLVPGSTWSTDNAKVLQRLKATSGPTHGASPSERVASTAWLQEVKNQAATPRALRSGDVQATTPPRFASLEEEWDSIQPQPPLPPTGRPEGPGWEATT